MRSFVPALVLAAIACTGPALSAEPMAAHFVDVGQGDATVLEFPCGIYMIDAGGQGEAQTDALAAYLDRLFERRQDLGRTIAAILVTHTHIDHTSSLRKVAETFTVERYIDSGWKAGIGAKPANWMRANARRLGIRTATYAHERIVRRGRSSGLISDFIDPIDCGDAGDPVIRLLAGPRTVNPGWRADDYRNRNEHSYVVRIDYGQASFLFTGDLEEYGIEDLVARAGGSAILDVDVYQVGHHGSHNATTRPLLDAMTPAIAVISMGRWDFGRDGNDPFTTYRYGHPRQAAVDLLVAAVSRTRPAKTVKVARRVRDFVDIEMSKAVYGTGWDGSVIVTTTGDGVYSVRTE